MVLEYYRRCHGATLFHNTSIAPRHSCVSGPLRVPPQLLPQKVFDNETQPEDIRNPLILAEREGFEPPVRANVQLISSQPHYYLYPIVE
jgi:hypothetical protein